MTAKKLTNMEKHAQEMCEAIRAGWCEGLTVEWVKNRTWGMCPRIEWRGHIVARATGCGYCKESTVLADALRFLADDYEAHVAIHGTAACGPEKTISVLAKCGWTMRRVARTRTTDTYTITRAANAGSGEGVRP